MSSCNFSKTFTLSGTESLLNATFYPPIELDPHQSYGLGMVGFYSFNVIPNIDDHNNKLWFIPNKYGNDIENIRNISIPCGTYEIEELSEWFKKRLLHISFEIKPIEHSQHCMIKIKGAKLVIKKECFLHTLFGFKVQTLDEGNHISENPVEITPHRVLRISSNITTGSYSNNDLNHCIHEFALNVPVGNIISEVPRHIIYLPLNTSSIKNLSITISNQDNTLVNFRGKDILIRLELKSF